ncbi:MAG: TPM domain-containing protein, partial [Candidatus Competibacteraceae bacterium]|nr:TPM domain-containing protein [Candidatus Competibacteraceae bacterium]
MKKLLILILLFHAKSLFALDIPAHNGQWLNDQAGVLSQQTVTLLNDLLRLHEENEGNQVVVLIINTLEGETIESFANQVFNAWRIGQNKTDNGVLLLVSMQDRAIRIEVGYGLEGELTDLEASEIIDYVIVPYFKNGDYDHGIIQGVNAILAAIKGAYEAPSKHKADNEGRNILWGIVLFFAFMSFTMGGGKGFWGWGCGFAFLLPILIIVFFTLPSPWNLIAFVALILAFLLRRLLGRKTNIGGGGFKGWGGGS